MEQEIVKDVVKVEKEIVKDVVKVEKEIVKDVVSTKYCTYEIKSNANG